MWIRGSRLPVAAELHHTLRLVTAPPLLVWQRLRQGVGAIEVAGVKVDVPSGTVSALIVGVHAAQHELRAATPIRDLRLALQRVGIETWHAAAALAHELGADPALAAGLRLDPGGRDLADRLGLTATPGRLHG